MYTPRDEMPPLVDNPPFFPAPHGASNGGEPGFFDAFPGARGGGGGGGGNPYPGSSPWGPPGGAGHTPYPTHAPQLSPWTPPSAFPPPNSAPVGGWPYGGYVAAGPPMWGPPPSAGPPPASPWGPPPALGGGAGWGPPSPYHPYTPAAGGFTAAFPGAGGGASPYAGPAPGTPFESSVGQPITGGWFGNPNAGGSRGGGGGTWGEGGWESKGWEGAGWDWHAEEKKKKKKHKSDHAHDDWALGGWDTGGSSMKRSHSHGAQGRRGTSLNRSASWGNPNPNVHGGGGGWPVVRQPGYAQGDLYDENNLSKRPRDWRPDYAPKQGLASYIPSLGRSRSTVKEFHDTVRRQIHPLFDLTDMHPVMSFDLRSEPFDPDSIQFFRLGRRHNDVDLLQLATRPASSFLRIMHPRLPWYIDVHESRPNGVLVGDVLSQIYQQLHMSIHGRHFWNDELGEAERGEIARAFQERVKDDGRGEEVVRRGILQVDFLGRKVWMEGLVRGPKGVWEMKTAVGD